MKPKSALEFLCHYTGTKTNDWEEMDGPDSGCGIDHWFYNKKTAEEWYVNEDQGDFTAQGPDEE